MLLFYIRHGDPIYTPDSLTPLGQRQAEALAKRLALYGMDQIYASSSERAKLTAAPTCELLKKEMTVLDWCNEHHTAEEMFHPRADGRRIWCYEIEEMRALFNSSDVRALGMQWYTHPAFADTRFAENMARVGQETERFMAQLGYVHDRERCGYIAARPNSQRVALFAHHGFGMSFLSLLLDIPYPIYSTHFDLSHSNMTVIELPDREGLVFPRVLQHSNDSHLYREGLPTKYGNHTYF
ncbi:MAG: histidine phosphatase family protein [Clostridia bacterium]|nr:histidine phosphatase family protein [Clostridia bacterium]